MKGNAMTTFVTTDEWLDYRDHDRNDYYYGSMTCPHGDRLGECDRGGCDEYPYE